MFPSFPRQSPQIRLLLKNVNIKNLKNISYDASIPWLMSFPLAYEYEKVGKRQFRGVDFGDLK